MKTSVDVYLTAKQVLDEYVKKGVVKGPWQFNSEVEVFWGGELLSGMRPGYTRGVVIYLANGDTKRTINEDEKLLVCVTREAPSVPSVAVPKYSRVTATETPRSGDKK